VKINRLFSTGENVSAVALGSWVLGGENWGGADDKESLAVVGEALAQGINFIDTAPFYGDGHAERVIGQAIHRQRDSAFIATKCGVLRENGRIFKTLAPASVMKEADESRSRLGMDVIDLYQCHWPDEKTPVEKTMEALLALRSRGRIRHIGVCNFSLPLLKVACAVAPVSTLQVPYSLLDRAVEAELLPFCVANKIGVIAYGSLGGGILSGKYVTAPHFDKRDARSMFYRFYTGDKFVSVKKGVEALRALGHPLEQVALNWVRQQPGVMTVLAGCRTGAQVRANAAAAEWDLSTDEIDSISRIVF